MTEPEKPLTLHAVTPTGWRPTPVKGTPEVPTPSFATLDTTKLAAALTTLEQSNTSAEITLLTDHVKALFLQVQSIENAIGSALEDIRQTVTALATSHQGHYHLIPAGLATFTYEGDQIRALTAEGALYQPRPDDFRTELQGTSGPLTPH